MLYVYTDTKLLGMEGIVLWHVLKKSSTGNAFLALQSESEGACACIVIRRDMWGMMRRFFAASKKNAVVTDGLLQMPVSFSLTKSKSDKNFVIGSQMPHNKVDIFLGLLLKGSEFPPMHSAFHIARRWGENKPERKTVHILSYRNAEESYVHFKPQD